MKKIIFYQSNFCQMGGVETMAYNWCWWLRNFFDITILYCSGDYKRIQLMKRLVKLEKYEEGKTYECDIFIRNSVWGTIPKNIKAKRMIEMRHANYKFLLEKGLLYQQYAPMGIKEIVGCGEFVSKMSNEVLHDNPTTIKNILMPLRKTNKVLHLISCMRLDPQKGWERMLILAQKLRDANIKFEWNIFTNSTDYKARNTFEEIHFWKQREDIWDYLKDADYSCLLSDSEGLPYTIQESLQYQVPCIVTDVGGCTELIKDGVNGYVVPLDMNFDVNKLLNIPKCKEYDNNALEDWLDYLGYEGKIDKQKIIDNFEEEKEKMFRVKCIYQPFYDDVVLGERKYYGDEYNIEGEERVKYLVSCKAIEVLEEIKPEPEKEPKMPTIIGHRTDDVEYVAPLDDENMKKLSKAIEKRISENGLTVEGLGIKKEIKPKKKKSSKK